MLVIARPRLVGLIGISALVIVGRVWLASIRANQSLSVLDVSVGSTASEVLEQLNPQLTNVTSLSVSLYPQFSYVQHGRYVFSPEQRLWQR